MSRYFGSTSVTSRVADQDAAGGHRLQPGDHAQRRGLAAARGAEQHQELAVRDVEVEALDHLDGAEGLADVARGVTRMRLSP